MSIIIKTLGSTLFSVLEPILENAAGAFISSRFHELNGIRKEQKKPAQEAINRAFEEWIIAIFNNLQAQEYEERDLRQFFEDYKKDIEIFLNDPQVAEELLKPFFATTTEYRIESRLLVLRWKALKLRELPEEFYAASVSRAYLKRVKKAGIVTSELRELFLAQLAQEQTVKTALQWLERSAKQGVTQAQNLISEIKREREREYEQLSLDELLIRAKTDGEQVYYFIGLKYYQGKEVRKDIDIALKYFYQAAKQGVIDAQNRISELEAEQDKQLPLTELFMKANKGEAQAQYLLGLRYYEDEDKDIYTALEWFEQAAEQYVVEAQDMISVIEKDYEQLPLQTLFTQAEIGDKQAQYLLGLKYYQGTEVQKNMNLALEWFYKAAEQDVVKAQDLISFIEKDYEQLSYHRQQEQDHKRFEEAVKKEENYRLFDEAVEKSIKMERDSFPLHKDFFTDFHDKKDQKRYYDRYFQEGMALYQAGQFTEAMPYILEVAQQGSAEAQIRLAHMYMNGEGVPKDVEKSEYWLRQSRNH